MKKITVSAFFILSIFVVSQSMAFAGGQCCMASGKVKKNFAPKNMKTAPAEVETKAK